MRESGERMGGMRHHGARHVKTQTVNPYRYSRQIDGWIDGRAGE